MGAPAMRWRTEAPGLGVSARETERSWVTGEIVVTVRMTCQ
jgi:hypothetical protein